MKPYNDSFYLSIQKKLIRHDCKTHLKNKPQKQSSFNNCKQKTKANMHYMNYAYGRFDAVFCAPLFRARKLYSEFCNTFHVLVLSTKA